MSSLTNQVTRVERELGGRKLIIEAGRFGLQAHGSVTVQLEGTMVLVNAIYGKPRPGFGGDFFPLTMDYRERTYAAGKFPGGFRKREGAPGTKEILTSRLMDRPHRPLFPEAYRDEVQVMAQTLSADGQNDPDILAMIGASASLHISEIPFSGPVGSVRIGKVGGRFIVMPTLDQLKQSSLEMVVSATRDAVMMLEGSAKQVVEDTIVEAILFGHEQDKVIVQMQEELRKKCGKPKIEVPESDVDEGMIQEIRSLAYDRLFHMTSGPSKREREDAYDAIRADVLDQIVGDSEDEEKIRAAAQAYDKVFARVVRDRILSGRRSDGRALNEIRELHCEVGIVPRVHGSALFRRGETQALVITTLGTEQDEQRVDGLSEEYSQHFMLHYNFPPFSTGEVKPIRGPGRREIGHGALAERSLEAVIPGKDQFPYTIRSVAEVVSSNGSTSQASVCGTTLSLMDAGVPISNPVAGISIGVILEENGDYKLITDIAGEEDHYGDMDFKIAGSQRGVTGIQLDIKVPGITEEIIRNTFREAKEARMVILRKLLQTLDRPRDMISKFAPRLIKVNINPDRIGAVIGTGGSTIKKIQDETGTKVDIADDGTVTISSKDAEGVEAAKNQIMRLTEQVEIGRVYQGEVKGIKDFGAFVEILPGQDGLVHVSEWSEEYVANMEDEVSLGDQVRVKVIAIDNQNRIKLSRKAVLAEQAGG